ncbi:hypothetical protein [Paenibacillus sp. UNC451MF]|uniref:hypothetical protein n=1 Tax=Paenibacillus sp. UNC451MF TaxID=1449063 RepID=UPI00049111E9|nr:hypothetical protein [Paenibacillus sp. UNC451MF]
MVDVFAVADILVKHIRNHHPQDVAIVGYYGSYLQGRATERSDLDFFFIPATSRGREVEMQFIIDGISFDFWPISWERAEKMASLEDWSTTIITDYELLYVRAEEDFDRFLSLRDTAAAMKDPTHADALINKAEAVLRNSVLLLTKMRLAGLDLDLSYCRTLAHEVSVDLFQILALINQTYYTRMWGHFREQVRNLPVKPEPLEQCLDTIMYSRSTNEIVQACEQMVADTVHLLAVRNQNQPKVHSYKARMKGYFEEGKGVLNKILTACEQGHYETAFFAAISFQDELARILYAAEIGRWPRELDLGEYRHYYRQFGYPDLAALLDSTDFEPLRKAVLELEERLENHLRSEGVPIQRFDSVAAFEAFVKSSSM